jgi:hypothetical protein
MANVSLLSAIVECIVHQGYSTQRLITNELYDPTPTTQIKEPDIFNLPIRMLRRRIVVKKKKTTIMTRKATDPFSKLLLTGSYLPD